MTESLGRERILTQDKDTELNRTVHFRVPRVEDVTPMTEAIGKVPVTGVKHCDAYALHSQSGNKDICPLAHLEYTLIKRR